MKITLNYGKETVSFTLPDKNYAGSLNPREAPGAEDGPAAVRYALEHPIGGPRLRDRVASGDRVVILVSDITRPAPSKILLPPLLEELSAAGVPDGAIHIVFGLGVHRRQTPEEQAKLVGADIFRRIRCLDHDIEDCRSVGATSRGAPVEIFKQVLDADVRIVTGNLEFHYFAGFSGGAKALAPGVCSRSTIQANHRRFLHPGAKGGMIDGNPLREEIEEIGRMVGIDFMLNAVLNSRKEIVLVVAGDVEAAHREGAEHIHRIFRREIEAPADIVITSPGGFPKDIDLYQTHKAMENAQLAVRPGGTIIVAGQCGDGLGETEFGRAMIEGKSPRELIEELERNFVLGRHKASRVARIHSEHEIYLVSGLAPELKKKLFVKNFDSVDAALKQALDVQGSDAQVLVMPYGVSTLPHLKN